MKVALGQVFFGVFIFSAVKVTSPVLHIESFVNDPVYSLTALLKYDFVAVVLAA
jgi:hypothetical protein